ncbi:hypothetical protein [uncultured Faecalicoccus sp.]|uniref:hypothetical protein n=1 Tax=uncultured Faecalicoccus sp. TaxID=1971760 RepID=UPI0025858C09|nr:hypothetical protein [uncultured Faecalicoccus sp.]
MDGEILEEMPVYEEPSRDILIGELPIFLCNELIQQINNQLVVTFMCDESMDDIVGAFRVCESFTYSDTSYEGYTIVKAFNMRVGDDEKTVYQITLEKLPEDPFTDDQEFALTYAVDNMPDEDALEHKSLFANWEDLGKGEWIPEGQRLNYNDKLWKCAKGHNKNTDYWPGKDPTLFEQLDKDEHEGTIDDPIPVPESVTTSGFTYIYGKYYSWNGATYLCKRGSVPNPEEMYGQEVKLTYAPDALIGHYFVTV